MAALPRDFSLLLAATAVSRVGTQVSLVALPLVAILVLQTSTLETALLATAETVAFLLVGLPAGVWVDRLRRRPILLATDVVRGVAILSVPVAAWLGMLSLPQLYGVAFVVGLMTVFFDIAHLSYLPFLVGRDRLLAGNARLEAVDYGAFTAGPGLGGLLVQLVTATTALMVDAVSYLVSALLVAAVRVREPAAEPAEQRGLWPEVRAGVALVVGHPVLRAVMTSGALLMLFETAWVSIQPIFLVRQLGLPPVAYGLLLAVGSAGGLLGALSASRVVSRFGAARVLRLAFLVTSPVMLLMPFAAADWRITFYVVGAFISSVGAAVFNVTQLTVRQSVTPPELHGRMNATMRFAMWGAMPVGGVIGGVLGQALGVRAALWVFAFGTLAAALPMLPARLQNSLSMTSA